MSPSPPSTPFPSELIDQAMPTLRDTEWRLLCVIVRQTLGWQDGRGRRKARDWLSHRQLRARTGRSSEAICRAIETLVAQGLIEVEDREGRRLPTPQERQCGSGPLFFRLGNRTGGENTSKTETGVSESETAKAKTTKQTESTKERGHRPLIHCAHDSRNPLNKPLLPQLIRAEDLRSLARLFLRSFQDKGWTTGRLPAPVSLLWARDEPIVMELLERCPYEQLEALADRFFSRPGAGRPPYDNALERFASFVAEHLAAPRP